MIEAGTSKPAPFDVVVVHSFSRFFRDHFELEFYVRKLAKNGVKLVSITQEMGDDPMHVMMRQIMALFDKYQSKENAKHVIRALKENARQGFWNGSLPPIGYRTVAAEQRGAKTMKKLEIDPLHGDTVRLINRLAVHGARHHWPDGCQEHRLIVMADREGFEPSVRFHVHTRSRRAPSTTRPPVLWRSASAKMQIVGTAAIYTDEFLSINPNLTVF